MKPRKRTATQSPSTSFLRSWHQVPSRENTGAASCSCVSLASPGGPDREIAGNSSLVSTITTKGERRNRHERCSFSRADGWHQGSFPTAKPRPRTGPACGTRPASVGGPPAREDAEPAHGVRHLG